MYDLEEIYDDIPIQTLYGLDTNCARDEYGFLHCAMSNLIPLGVSKSNWAKYSCDRLIEELMKYPYVYFLRQVCSLNFSTKLSKFYYHIFCFRERKEIKF